MANYLDDLLKQAGGWGPDLPQGSEFDPMQRGSVLTGWGEQAAKEKNQLNALFQSAVMAGDLEKASQLAVTPEHKALLNVAYGQKINDQDRRARMDAGRPYDAPVDLVKNYNDQQYTNVLRNQAQQDRMMKMQAAIDASRLSQAHTEQAKAATVNAQLKPIDQVKPIWDSERGVFITPPNAGGSPSVVTPPGLAPKVKPTPQFVVEGVIQNTRAIKSIDEALGLLGTPEGANAVGWKAKLPNKILNEYVDPEGVNTRASIADVGSLQIKNRSGATVTAAEEPRLLPFIPLPTDDDATAKKKLTRLKAMIESENNSLTEFYPDASKHVDTLKAKVGPPQSGGTTIRRYNPLTKKIENVTEN